MGGSTTVADVLSDVLRSVRLTGAEFFDVVATSPWVAEAPSRAELAPLVMPGARHLIEYHVVTDGACWAGTVDWRPSLGHGRTTSIALIHLANLLQEVVFYRRPWRTILRALFPRKITSLNRPSSWPKLGHRSTATDLAHQSGPVRHFATETGPYCGTVTYVGATTLISGGDSTLLISRSPSWRAGLGDPAIVVGGHPAGPPKKPC